MDPQITYGEKCSYLPDYTSVCGGAESTGFLGTRKCASGSPDQKVFIKLFKHTKDFDFDKTAALVKIFYSLRQGARIRENVRISPGGDFCGIAIDFRPGVNLCNALESGQIATLTLSEQLKLCGSLASAVNELIQKTKGYDTVFTDLAPQNINVDPETYEVVMFDLDSVWVSNVRTPKGNCNFRGVIGTEGYIPDERLRFPDRDPEPSSMLYSLAAIIFEVLHGKLPCQPKVSPSTQGTSPSFFIIQGVYPKYLKSREFFPPEYYAQSRSLSREIDEALKTSLLSSPNNRVTAEEWMRLLSSESRRWRIPSVRLPMPRRRYAAAALLLSAGVGAGTLYWDRLPQLKTFAPVEVEKAKPVPLPPKSPSRWNLDPHRTLTNDQEH